MKVFLSSTKADLDEYRQSVFEEIKSDYEVLRMEDFPSGGTPPLDFCLALVEQSHVCLVLVGYRYGSRSFDAGISYTEAEYEHAHTHRKPVHGYVRTDFDRRVDASSQPEVDKASLRAFRQVLEAEQVVRRPYFQGKAQLAERVRFDLDFWRTNGVLRPTFGRSPSSVRRPTEYTNESSRRSLSRAVPFPIVLVNLSILDFDRFPGDAGGRLVRKILGIEELLRAKDLQVSIFNQLDILTTHQASVLEQRLRLFKRNSELIVCFAKADSDLAKLTEFADVQEKVVVWHMEGTSLPDGFRPMYARQYTVSDLADCLLKIEAERHTVSLATQRLYSELALG